MITVKQRDPWVYTLLGEHNFQQKKGFLLWWYKLTSPPDVETPTLKQRAAARQSKILSALALFLGLTLIMVAYVALTGPNRQIINTVYVLYTTLFICLVLNRRGHIYIAGSLLIVGLVGGIYFTLIMTALHGGLSPNDKDIIYLPFFGELVAAALLPPFALFIVATFNVSFSLLILYYAPHKPAFTQMLVTDASSIVFRIVDIHFFVTLVLWIMATWTLISVKQANRASELARLEHDLKETANEKVKEKEQLEQSIGEIIAVHMQIANGNLEAKVPIKRDEKNVLWQIAIPLNNLIARYQQAKHEAQEREVLLQVLNRLVHEDPSLGEKATAYLHEQRLLQQRGAPSIKMAR